MAFGANSGDPDQPLSEINVTPLVDVMLVLLVIFIVAAPLMAQALRVDLPRAAAPTASEPEVVSLVLARDGALELDGKPIQSEMLEPLLAALISARPEAVLRLGSDSGIAYGEVVKLLSRLKQAGIRRIAFATQAPEG